jgi:ribosomal protein S18 acetylase RimI-like enzyme
MYISTMTTVTQEVFQAFQSLIPQLTYYTPPPSLETLEKMADSDQIFVFLARESDQNGAILGSATLATFVSPTGTHGWIEDVIVDRDARRRGIGRALTEACLEKARGIGLREVNLTSRPSREAANQLYQKMGFQQRETNVYRYPLQ